MAPRCARDVRRSPRTGATQRPAPPPSPHPAPRGPAMARSIGIADVRRRTSLAGLHLLERPSILGPVLVAPAILYILVLVGYPFVLAVYLSMTDTDVATTGLGRFVGLDNFVALTRS